MNNNSRAEQCTSDFNFKIQSNYVKLKKIDPNMKSWLCPVFSQSIYFFMLDIESRQSHFIDDNRSLVTQVNFLIKHISRSRNIIVQPFFSKEITKLKIKNFSEIEESIIFSMTKFMNNYHKSFLVFKFSFDKKTKLLKMKITGICLPGALSFAKINLMARFKSWWYYV